jgi:hypothetical protein
MFMNDFNAIEGKSHLIGVSLRPGKSNRKGAALVELSGRIQNSTINLTPADIATARRGSLITIEVTATLSGNSPFTGRVIPDQVNRVRTIMVKE